MASKLDELTMQYEEDGILKVKELDKLVLSKGGAWVTLLFKYQDWNATLNDYGPIKFSIRRYQSRNGVYRQQSKFNISNVDQAKKLIAALNTWIDALPAEKSPDAEHDTSKSSDE
jgi:hypothetical protein